MADLFGSSLFKTAKAALFVGTLKERNVFFQQFNYVFPVFDAAVLR